MSVWPYLQDIGSFELERLNRHTLIKHDQGSGYQYVIQPPVLEQARWRLVWKVLPDVTTDNSPVDPVTEEPIAKARYLWDLFNESKRLGDRPLIVNCPFEQIEYLAVFEEDEISFTLFAIKLYSSRLTLKQRRLEGYSDSGLPLDAPNEETT